jgi:hypothetical protein
VSTATQPQPLAASPALPEVAQRARTIRGWWLTTAVVALVMTAVFTWPLPVHLDGVWKPYLRGQPLPSKPYVPPYSASDALQTAFIQTQVIDNLLHLRDPYLDRDEGAAGPAPLRTTSLDTPWIALTAVVWPLLGLATAFNLMMLLGSALTVVTAMGLLRRHTRWPLLALAGACLYAFVPYRMVQLAGHFNAVMWWALPAVAWAFEVMLERWREGGRWHVPAAWLIAVTLVVAISGEFHLTIYTAGLLVWLALWSLGAARLAHRAVPVVPLALAVGAAAVACLYSLLAFRWAFHGGVAGNNGDYGEVIFYAPRSLGALVRKSTGAYGEGYIYMGWWVVLLAAAGLVLALRRSRLRGYALLLPVVLLLTYGPTLRHVPHRLGLGDWDPYRLIVAALPPLRLQRVTGRIMVLTALLIVLLAVVAVDALGRLIAARSALLLRAGAVLLMLGTIWLARTYMVMGSAVMPAMRDNQVTIALAQAGDRAGPFLGIPLKPQEMPVNSATTFLAAQARRATLNAYNQTSAPWLAERNERLAKLNDGIVTEEALAVLRSTGTRQVVVIDGQSGSKPGQARAVADRLVASGHFQRVTSDDPLTLLRFTG